MNERKKIIFRLMQNDFQTLRTLQDNVGKKEMQTFLLCCRAEGPNEVIYLTNTVLVPEPKDFEEQSAASVIPTAEFQATAYGLAYDLGLSIFDVHTHPFSQHSVQLSSTDFHHGEKNARCIAEKFPEDTRMGMVVWGDSMKSFDGRVWDRGKEEFQRIDQLEILGSPIQILPMPDKGVLCAGERFSRHKIIPQWDQEKLGQLKIFSAGLGGNGSIVLSALLGLGVGRNGGWIKACDPDVVEESNLPRIPYATPQDVGKPKAEIAELHALAKSPQVPAKCYQKKLQDEEMSAIAKEAHVLIGAVDSEGCRKTLNSISARYLIPYIDIATEIIPEDSSCQSIGQVHTFIPGQNGCLTCMGLIDPTEAALDLLSEEHQAERAGIGYVRGTNETPTPSVLHLNGVTSYLAISQLLRLVFGEDTKSSEFLNYNRQDCQLLPAEAPRDPDCPVCGNNGYMGEGDKAIEERPDNEPPRTFQMKSGKVVEDKKDADKEAMFAIRRA